MAKLPFVVEPRRKPILERIGTEDSGIIEVERRGYLTTGEKSFVQQVQQLDGGASEIVTITRKVARKYALGMDAAYNLVLSIIGGFSTTEKENSKLAEEIEVDFAEELTNAVKSMAASQAREEMVMAACILKYRIDPDYDISDIAALHPDLISGLAGLYRDEDRRSIEAFTSPSGGGELSESKGESFEESEKKPVKATGSRSKNSTGG